MSYWTKIQKSKPATIGLLASLHHWVVYILLADQYMVHWAELSMETKQEVIHSWAKMPSYSTINDTGCNSIIYMLPTLAPPEKHLWICKNGLSELLNIGR
eukprot:494774-Ditylum_brightwellii.AAC.1